MGQIQQLKFHHDLFSKTADMPIYGLATNRKQRSKQLSNPMQRKSMMCSKVINTGKPRLGVLHWRIVPWNNGM
jgi:hypothetical protein